MMRPHAVHVYEPNDENPYGVELSATLNQFVSDTVLWVNRDRDVPPIEGVSIRKVLGGGIGRRRHVLAVVKAVVARFAGPIIVCFRAGLRQPLVLVWTRDAWDASIFLSRAFLGGPTVLIYHDPASIRRRSGLGGWAERKLVRRVQVVVHSDYIAEQARLESNRVSVVSHPPYIVTRGQVDADRARLVGSPARLAFVGSFRSDKRPDDLLPIARHLPSQCVLEILGKSKFSPEKEEHLRSSGVKVRYPVGDLSDAELVERLVSCDVMLAPYESVTESGSVIMAISVGTPVLGYSSPGLSRLLKSDSLASSADELGEMAAAFLQEPWETSRLNWRDLRDRSVRDWKVVLSAIR